MAFAGQWRSGVGGTTLLLIYAILFRPTRYPRWFILVIPTFLYLAQDVIVARLSGVLSVISSRAQEDDPNVSQDRQPRKPNTKPPQPHCRSGQSFRRHSQRHASASLNGTRRGQGADLHDRDGRSRIAYAKQPFKRQFG